MGRLVNTESAGKARSQLVREIVFAIRELQLHKEIDNEVRDLVAYIALTLEQIEKTIDVTVAPWEKRNYWVKADKFRQDWAWARALGNKLTAAILREDWGEITLITSRIFEKLSGVRVSTKRMIEIPWTGAWEVIKSTPQKH